MKHVSHLTRDSIWKRQIFFDNYNYRGIPNYILTCNCIQTFIYLLQSKSCLIFNIYTLVMIDEVTEMGDYFQGTRNQPKSGLKASWTRLFSFIFVKFLHIWSFFIVLQGFQDATFLKSHQICSKNMPKGETCPIL